MVTGPLSNMQVDEFIERGWTLLRQAFPRAVAEAVRRDLGGRIGIDLEQAQQWTTPRVWLQEMMKDRSPDRAVSFGRGAAGWSEALEDDTGHGVVADHLSRF